MLSGCYQRLQQPRQLAGLLLFAGLVLAPLADAAGEYRLKELRGEIKRTERVLANQKSTTKELQTELQSTEQRIGELAQRQRETERELGAKREELARLAQQRTELLAQQQHQKRVLGQQIISAYTRGGHDYTKLLLSQSGAGQLERVLAYYGFLNDARVQAIEALKETGFALFQVEEQLAAQERALKDLLARQEQERADLDSRNTLRERTLSRLKRDMNMAEQQLSQLQESEQSLRTVIAEARKPVAGPSGPSNRGLAGKQKRLSWPARGHVSKRFGQPRQGGLSWKGVMLAAREGSEVTAVAAGNVVYANWVKGFGLLMVIDHGQGYMSIYGHNQALLRQAGDDVREGEPIALVGRSGGHSEPGLYFEIRHQGAAVDPARWCR